MPYELAGISHNSNPVPVGPAQLGLDGSGKPGLGAKGKVAVPHTAPETASHVLEELKARPDQSMTIPRLKPNQATHAPEGRAATHLKLTDTAADRPVTFTFSVEWEDKAFGGQGPDKPTKTQEIARLIAERAGVPYEPEGENAREGSVDVVSVPRPQIENALREAGKVAKDQRLEISETPGAYKVWEGPDAGKVRTLASITVGFEPAASKKEIEEAGSMISKILRQESITSLSKKDDGGMIVMKLQLHEDRDKSQDAALMTNLSERYGGATQTKANEMISITNFGHDQPGFDQGRYEANMDQALDELSTHPSVALVNFDRAEGGFPSGQPRIRDAALNKTELVDKLFQPASSDANSARAPKDSRIDPGNDRSRLSLQKRFEATFDLTHKQLFGAKMRPAHQSYVFIDEHVRLSTINPNSPAYEPGGAEKEPMHWGIRMVTLNPDRTKIDDLWSSELVLDTGRHAGAHDPAIGLDTLETRPPIPMSERLAVREESGEVRRPHPQPLDHRHSSITDHDGSQIPKGWDPGSKMVKDQGINSPNYIQTGSFMIPVDDVSEIISDSKELTKPSKAQNDKYTNDTNCIAYAGGLTFKARPVDANVAKVMNIAFGRNVVATTGVGATVMSSQAEVFSRTEVSSILANNPPADGVPMRPLAGRTPASERGRDRTDAMILVRSATPTVDAAAVHQMRNTDQLANHLKRNTLSSGVPGLRVGDTSYAKVVNALQKVAETTFQPNFVEDGTGLDRAAIMLQNSDIDAQWLAQTGERAPEEVKVDSANDEYRQKVVDWYNGGFRSELANARGTEAPAHSQPLGIPPTRLEDLGGVESKVDVNHWKTPRRNSAPAAPSQTTTQLRESLVLNRTDSEEDQASTNSDFSRDLSETGPTAASMEADDRVLMERNENAPSRTTP